MRLINVKAFLEREQLISRGKGVDHRAKVLEFGDDEVTKYAMLSHRWIGQEVDYTEIIELAKMAKGERNKIRERDGYQKILQSCKQAKMDEYEWLWVDTCCIDKRSSAELSEAINSMYRWYENSGICYVYLHDLPGSSFPIADDYEMYPKSSGWPEWFSRGWTLQEMIAPRDVRFFNRDWHFIGDKRVHSSVLENITRVPQEVLKEGLSSDRPCVAQIMSWAANRTTTRVEDKAYSLMGLLDVNMPMLYGEGKKAFHRLQLEIIRSSNDQSIFAWSCNDTKLRTGSILADDPSFFEGCDRMELMDRDDFIESLRRDIPEEQLPWIEDDRFGSFPITNRGIQIWLYLRPHVGSDSVFRALLPCRSRPSGPPVAIILAWWESNYYRYSGSMSHEGGHLQLRQVYLRYQGTSHCNSIFKIDDIAVNKEGFAYKTTLPKGIITENAVTLSVTDPLCVIDYSCGPRYHFAVGFGQCFGQNWIHAICEAPDTFSWNTYASMRERAPEHAQSMKKLRSGAASCRVCIMETSLPLSTWILQTSCVVWNSSRICGVKLDVFRSPSCSDVSGEWTAFDVDGTDDPNHDWRGLMIPHYPSKRYGCELLVDEVPMKFSFAPNDIKLGDYGRITDSEDFRYEGNLLRSFSSRVNITPRQHKISAKGQHQSESDVVKAYHNLDFPIELYKPLGQSLPSDDDDFKSLLVSSSTRLTNKYLVTRVIRCPPDPRRSGSSATYWYNLAKPFVWHRNEGAGSVVGEAAR